MLEAVMVFSPSSFADLSQRVDGGQRCRLDETPDAALARSDDSRDTSRQQAIVQMAQVDATIDAGSGGELDRLG